MKVPCRDCLVLSKCRQKINTIRSFEINICPMVNSYINSDEIMRRRPRYRQARVNKIRKTLRCRELEVKNDNTL
jgi:hypothetical protein